MHGRYGAPGVRSCRMPEPPVLRALPPARVLTAVGRSAAVGVD
jgi:hypothetical protein